MLEQRAVPTVIMGTFEFEASDAASPVIEAEYSLDAKKWTRVEPRDGLSDSLKESYAIHLAPEARGGYLLIRRRRPDAADPDLADVPLVLHGLSK